MGDDRSYRGHGLGNAHDVARGVVDVSFVTTAFVREGTGSMCPVAVVRRQRLDRTGKHADVQGNKRDR